ncbi:MAG: hypothetical protein AAB460_02485 [Patescibacteria group bacterium]
MTTPTALVQAWDTYLFQTGLLGEIIVGDVGDDTAFFVHQLMELGEGPYSAGEVVQIFDTRGIGGGKEAFRQLIDRRLLEPIVDGRRFQWSAKVCGVARNKHPMPVGWMPGQDPNQLLGFACW